MTSIENRENFYSLYIDDLVNKYYILKDRYKLLGFMDNTKIENFIEIILDNLIFRDNPIENNENDESDDEISDDDYFQ